MSETLKLTFAKPAATSGRTAHPGTLTTGQQVKVKLCLFAVDVGNDGVTGIVAAGATCAHVGLGCENVD